MSKFGSDIPFAEPAWYQGQSSPYYLKPSHRELRQKVREFVNKEIIPNVEEWEEAQDYPRELHEKAYKAGVYGLIWPIEYGGNQYPDHDVFHELIYFDEIARAGAGGMTAACFSSIKIGLPPILKVGSPFLKEKVCPEVIAGKKIVCLCITEPQAGSDVSNITTTARREGNFYIVNGQKKFITSGMKADFFTVAVRTGGEGMGGISLLLLERSMPGITLRKMKTQGWHSSNTAHILFEDVRVPVENLIGKENYGFQAIMLNFNMERFTICISAIRASRMCLEDSVKYARVRRTFGKPLIENQTIRHKIAEMAMRIETSWAMLEHVAHQIHTAAIPPAAIGGNLALLKVRSTKDMEFCAREASHVLGGNSYLRAGPGSRVERIYREVRVLAIGGGSEEVMLDLAMRQAKI